jgi:acyl-CoA synthetase (AMP-forming)/AMP-acid ligase II
VWSRLAKDKSVRNPAADNLVLGRLLRATTERYGDGTFLQFGTLTRAFGDVDRLTNCVANGLAALGVERGFKVAIMAPNGPAFVDAWLGAVPSPCRSTPTTEATSSGINLAKRTSLTW